MWHDSSCDMIYFVTWLIHTWHELFICNMTDSYLYHHAFKCDLTHSNMTCLVHMWHAWLICDMTHLHVSRLIYLWDDSSTGFKTHSYIGDENYAHVTWLIIRELCICDMIRSLWCHAVMSRDVWVMSHMQNSHGDVNYAYVTWRIILVNYGMTHPTWQWSWMLRAMMHQSLTRVTCLIYMCAMTHSHVRHDPYVWHDSFHDSFVCLMNDSSHMCDMTHSMTRPICVTWLIQWLICVFHEWFIPYVWHDSFHDSTHMCDMTHSMTHSCVSWMILMWHDAFLHVWLVTTGCWMLTVYAEINVYVYVALDWARFVPWPL